MRTAGLFAGVGALDLGLTRAGHESTLLCEVDGCASRVLEQHFTGARLTRDVRELRTLPRGVELIAAGFPCQDLSQAGTTRGLAGARSGLVGEVFRLLGATRAPWVVLENVPFMLRLGGGAAMTAIVRELIGLGYAWAYRTVNSLAFGVPQRRERVIIVATRAGDPRDVLFADEVGSVAPESTRHATDVACGFYWTEGLRGLGWAVDAVPTLKGGSAIGIPSPPAIVLPSRRVITLALEDAERAQGLSAGWTLAAQHPAHRGIRWRLVGNAVTVPVAEWLGRRLRRPSEAGRAVASTPLQRGDRWPRAAFGGPHGASQAHISSFPAARRRAPLAEWLGNTDSLLSRRATEGFLKRASVSSLHFPTGFIQSLENHLRSLPA